MTIDRKGEAPTNSLPGWQIVSRSRQELCLPFTTRLTTIPTSVKELTNRNFKLVFAGLEWVQSTKFQVVFIRDIPDLHVPSAPTTPCISQNGIIKYIQDKERTSKEVRELQSALCSFIKSKSSDVIRVWTGYEMGYENVPIFVAVMKRKHNDLDKDLGKYWCFKIIQRLLDEVSTEGKLCLKEEAKRCLKEENGSIFSMSEHSELQQTIARHSSRLMSNHSNLLLISASKIKSSRKLGMTSMLCIVLYVHVKCVIPVNEEPFPDQLDRFSVDVREGIFYTYGNSKLTMGCNISSAYSNATLGGFVSLPNGKVGCLTCWHMFDNSDCQADNWQHCKDFDRDVYHSQPNSSPKTFGKLVDAKKISGNENTIGVDAALIEITDRFMVPEDGCFSLFPDASTLQGYSDTKPIEFHSGDIIFSAEEAAQLAQNAKCKMVRYNKQLGLRFTHTGFLHCTGSSVNAWWPTSEEENCRLLLQMEISPDEEEVQLFECANEDPRFTVEGDSGSLVFLVSESDSDIHIWALGMVVGGTSQGTGIITPIWAILDSFKLPPRLLSFENQRLRKLELHVQNLHSYMAHMDRRLDVIDQRTANMDTKLDKLLNNQK